jgi:hypothetical protein
MEAPERCTRESIDRIYLLTMRASLAEQFYEKRGFAANQKMILMGKRLQYL